MTPLHNTWWKRRKLRRERSCPHSLVSAKGTCQMCGRRRVDQRQVAAQFDGSACGPVGSTAPADPHTTGFDAGNP